MCDTGRQTGYMQRKDVSQCMKVAQVVCVHACSQNFVFAAHRQCAGCRQQCVTSTAASPAAVDSARRTDASQQLPPECGWPSPLSSAGRGSAGPQQLAQPRAPPLQPDKATHPLAEVSNALCSGWLLARQWGQAAASGLLSCPCWPACLQPHLYMSSPACCRSVCCGMSALSERYQ